MKRTERFSGVGRKGSHGRAAKRAKIFPGHKSDERVRSPSPSTASDRPSSSASDRPGSSASDRKISREYESSDSAGYRLFHIETLFRTLREHLCCKKCGGSIIISEVSLKGLGGTYGIACENCIKMEKFNSSPMIENTRNAFEINRRAVLAMRCIGQGLDSLATFCGVMDLPPAIKRPTYNKVVQHMLKATSEVASTVFHRAVEEEIEASATQETRVITVQCDGTWQKRGFKSLNGVCTVIGSETGKVIDIEVLSAHCNACARWKGKQTGEEWLTWYEQHKPHCQANHTGSSGAMEVNGMVRIFQRSEEKYNTKYVGYIGDGDTKSFAAVKKAEPYGPDVEIQKIECCGHVQKKFGTHMRKEKLRQRGQKLADGRPLGGKGRLTDVIIDEMQSYYGNAIRNNSGSVDGMSKAIWAIWHHKCSTDANPQHHLCPSGETSWCQYNKAVATGSVEQYKHKNSLPTVVMEAIKPVFEKLTSPALLARCIGGKTQNANESLNNVIWKICPKRVYTGPSLIRVAANMGAVTFSEGATGILKIMTALGVTPGTNARTRLMELDQIRLKQAEQQAARSSREARVAFRRLRLAEDEATVDAEGGPSYAAGAF